MLLGSSSFGVFNSLHGQAPFMTKKEHIQTNQNTAGKLHEVTKTCAHLESICGAKSQD
jgi:hypothetical protein